MSNAASPDILTYRETESFTQTDVNNSVESITAELNSRIFENIKEIELQNEDLTEARSPNHDISIKSIMRPKETGQGPSKKSSCCDLCKDNVDVLSMRTRSSSGEFTEICERDNISSDGTIVPGKPRPGKLCNVIRKSMIRKDKKRFQETESKSSNEMICRICHGGDSTDDLITPCRCRGTVAVVHLVCLERWLRESSHSYCELCQHHYKIIRQPKYSIPKSILVFLRHPGEHLKEILVDLLAFSLYTPSAVASTYMLMMICESLMKNNIIVSGSLSSHLIAFSAVFGMAAIDFSYSSWLLMIFHKHYSAWKEWYRNTSEIRVIFSNMKMRTLKKKAGSHKLV